jgi:preprotein translocase subunit SecG
VTALITIVHVLICVVLIVAVLLQSGKAADLAGAFGGAGSQTAFGPRSQANILAKVTEVCAILLMLTSLGLWVFSGREGGSAVRGVAAPAKNAPVTETKKDAAPSSQTAATQPPAAQPAAKPDDKKAVEQKPAAPVEKKAPAPETKK